jgi:hypothetical protein
VGQPSGKTDAGGLHRFACRPAGQAPARGQFAGRADQGETVGQPLRLAAGLLAQIPPAKPLLRGPQFAGDLSGVSSTRRFRKAVQALP